MSAAYLVLALVALDQLSKVLALFLLPDFDMQAGTSLLGFGVTQNGDGPLFLYNALPLDAHAWRWLMPIWGLSLLSIMWISNLPDLPIALLVGGGMSNACEMLVRGSVTDFITIRLADGALVANLADVMVTSSFLVTLAMALMGTVGARHFGISWFEK